jgi:hypothetical protein
MFRVEFEKNPSHNVHNISINGLKPGFFDLPYFELSEVGIMY